MKGRGGGGIFRRGRVGQFILRPFSHFQMQDLKIQKFFSYGALIFNIHIFRFKTDAGFINIDTLEG